MGLITIMGIIKADARSLDNGSGRGLGFKL